MPFADKFASCGHAWSWVWLELWRRKVTLQTWVVTCGGEILTPFELWEFCTGLRGAEISPFLCLPCSSQNLPAHEVKTVAVEVLDCVQCWPSRGRHFTAMELREKYNLLAFFLLAMTRTQSSAPSLPGQVGRNTLLHPSGSIPSQCSAPPPVCLIDLGSHFIL